MERDEYHQRVRRICGALPGSTEKLSHGEPTFFANKKVYAMLSIDHHHDEHMSVIVPAAPGFQEAMIAAQPKKFYRPPYVGVKGWIGIELSEVDDEELGDLITDAWKLITTRKQRRK